MRRMNKFMKLSYLALAATMLFSCGGGNGGNTELVDQNIKVTAFNKFVLENVKVDLYDGKNLVATGTTDSKGEVTIEVPGYDEYSIVLSDLQAGFYVEGTYNTNSTGEDIVVDCKTTISSEVVPYGTKYELGSVIYDFSFKNTDGDTITASEVLKDKKAILVNMFYEECYYCNEEFPLLESAYQNYKDEIEFFALDPYDTLKSIKSYREQKGLTFHMGEDTPGFTSKLNVQGFPTTFMIDRYGTICNITTTGAFQSMLDLNLFIGDVLDDEYVPEVLAAANVDTPEDEGNGPVVPNVTMPESSVIEDAINGEGYTFAYYPETDEEDAKYSWPWVVSEDGESIKPSNYTIDNSYAIIYSDFNIKKDQAVAFDFKTSTEAFSDVVYVIVDGEKMGEISGESDEWQTCYPFVGLKSGKHQLALVYVKDQSSSVGDDAVYIKNMRIVSADTITTPTYIIRDCYKGSSPTGAHLFITPVYNEEDGFYHVDTVDGPLILADLLNSTIWNEYALLDIASNGLLTDINGVDYTDIIIDYAGLAVNGGWNLVPVTRELQVALDAIGQYNPRGQLGEKEWLLMCNYFSAYGTNGEEFPNPIKGLATFCAYDAQMGSNTITFESTIVPRGKFLRFVPETTGVYKIQSQYVYTGNSELDATLNHSAVCWIFDRDENMLAESTKEARTFYTEEDHDNFILYFEFEAGKEYFICPAFDDLYRYTDLTFTLEYVGLSHDSFTACAPGYFTTDDVDVNGMPSGNIIALGIDIVLGDDEYYHAVNSDGTLGSIIYCDFSHPTSIFTKSIEELIEGDAFNFALDDEGKNTVGVDNTEAISKYLSKMITAEGDTKGCVPVDAELANILQRLMDKYTYKDVENSWLKLCYYYKHYGA